MFLCNEKLTLIKIKKTNDGEQFQTVPLFGCSWHGKTGIGQTEKGIVPQNTYESRIPVGSISPDVIPQKGDYLVRGIIEEVLQVPGDFSTIEYMKITAVKDNRRGIERLWHWQVEGA